MAGQGKAEAKGGRRGLGPHVAPIEFSRLSVRYGKDCRVFFLIVGFSSEMKEKIAFFSSFLFGSLCGVDLLAGKKSICVYCWSRVFFPFIAALC